ncbi:hypothetical protein AYL99_01397 [Fonsecaea erecta]|uniref:Kinetochore protein mis14 n=1 Tax=Fonsecaea erecta TaxID=1367422 RepID=A0A179A2R2_9EURO|nr:hypothetical protein AYL99_01397 [Fonsecaea erecta]OAP65425.1 hypothetical protein AYL99_01397 [Fonsecaea erecta]
MAHPDAMADRHQRKVELQSPNDLKYLQSNLLACAHQKLDLHFPPSAAVPGRNSPPATMIQLDGVQQPNGAEQSRDNAQDQDGDKVTEEDPLRARVRTVVEAFIARTWEGACKNITVNGLDATNLPGAGALATVGGATSVTGCPQREEQREEMEAVDFVYQAYDSRLQAQVAALYGELETLTTQVSKLRRTAPAQGAEMLAKRLQEEIEADNREFERRRMAVSSQREAADSGDDDILKMKPRRDGWFDDVSTMFDRGTNELAALAGVNRAEGDEADHHRLYGPSLTETLGKIQRARTVAMEFE